MNQHKRVNVLPSSLEDVSCQKVKKVDQNFGSSAFRLRPFHNFVKKVDQKVDEYIHFHNATPFPVMIDTWINTKLESFKVPPHHLILLTSSVGEWHMNTLFPNRKDRELWDQHKGLRHFTQIGKFRNKPCAQGNYAWMEYEKPFHCMYSEFSESQVKGLITFSWSWRKEELEKENKNYC